MHGTAATVRNSLRLMFAYSDRNLFPTLLRVSPFRQTQLASVAKFVFWSRSRRCGMDLDLDLVLDLDVDLDSPIWPALVRERYLDDRQSLWLTLVHANVEVQVQVQDGGGWSFATETS